MSQPDDGLTCGVSFLWMQVVLASAVASRQRSRRYRPASELAADVAGAGEAEACSARLQELLGEEVDTWLRRYALNVRCFTAAAALAGSSAGGGASAVAKPAAGMASAGAQVGPGSSGSEQASAAVKARDTGSASIAPSATTRREARAEMTPSVPAASGDGSRRERERVASGADVGQGVSAQSSLRSDAASRAAAALEAAAAAKARRARRAAAEDIL